MHYKLLIIKLIYLSYNLYQNQIFISYFSFNSCKTDTKFRAFSLTI
jgi:hypothetical protein